MTHPISRKKQFAGVDELMAAIAFQARQDLEGYDSNPWCQLDDGHYIHSTDPEEIDRYGVCVGDRCSDHEGRQRIDGPHAKAHRVATCAHFFVEELQERINPATMMPETQGETQPQDDPMGALLEIVSR